MTCLIGKLRCILCWMCSLDNLSLGQQIIAYGNVRGHSELHSIKKSHHSLIAQAHSGLEVINRSQGEV